MEQKGLATNQDFTFETLVEAIQATHESMHKQATQAVNISLTIRNWLFGLYITEYEQNGFDRAQYGSHLLQKLSHRLIAAGIKDVSERNLRLFRQFYGVYPQIWQTLSAKFKSASTSSPHLSISIVEKLSVETQKKRCAVPPQLVQPGPKLVENLSFSKFCELLKIDDDLKRTFYEIECIKGNWSVRELKRQIASLYFERSGLSKNKEKLSEMANQDAITQDPKMAIRDPMIFEFLGLKAKEVLPESDLERSLIDKLQEFMLELGHGFCFEAKQKRILIGGEHYFVDLVFYNRVLKCHVLVELKVDEFSHQHLGQLNTYVSWYKKHEMTEGDNPPIGILLCTKKSNALAEYALAGMDNQLFISKYQFELPKKEEIEKFLDEQLEQKE